MPSQCREETKIILPESCGGTAAMVADQKSDWAVVVTHPWGPVGGNLHNNVVVAVVRYFQRLKITTIRFDFVGSQIGRGTTQVHQAVQVANGLLSGELQKLAHSGNRVDGDTTQHQEGTGTSPMKTIGSRKSSKILLVGYSYGSLVAASASADLGAACVGCIIIAPPFGVAHWLFLFNSNYHLERAAAREDLPRLLIMGDQDNFTSQAAFERTVESKFSARKNNSSTIMQNVDHFFVGRERVLMNVIGEWVSNTFPQEPGANQSVGLADDNVGSSSTTGT